MAREIAFILTGTVIGVWTVCNMSYAIPLIIVVAIASAYKVKVMRKGN